MALKLYFHPLASFCHKALIALYENRIAFERIIFNLGDEASRAAFHAVWPMPAAGSSPRQVTRHCAAVSSCWSPGDREWLVPDIYQGQGLGHGKLTARIFETLPSQLK